MEERSHVFFAQRQHPHSPSGSSSSAKPATNSSMRYIGAPKCFSAVHAVHVRYIIYHIHAFIFQLRYLKPGIEIGR